MIETKAKYDKSRIFQIFCLKHEQNQEILGTINNCVQFNVDNVLTILQRYEYSYKNRLPAAINCAACHWRESLGSILAVISKYDNI